MTCAADETCVREVGTAQVGDCDYRQYVVVTGRWPIVHYSSELTCTWFNLVWCDCDAFVHTAYWLTAPGLRLRQHTMCTYVHIHSRHWQQLYAHSSTDSTRLNVNVYIVQYMYCICLCIYFVFTIFISVHRTRRKPTRCAASGKRRERRREKERKARGAWCNSVCVGVRAQTQRATHTHTHSVSAANCERKCGRFDRKESEMGNTQCGNARWLRNSLQRTLSGVQCAVFRRHCEAVSVCRVQRRFRLLNLFVFASARGILVLQTLFFRRLASPPCVVCHVFRLPVFWVLPLPLKLSANENEFACYGIRQSVNLLLLILLRLPLVCLTPIRTSLFITSTQSSRYIHILRFFNSFLKEENTQRTSTRCIFVEQK